MMSAKNLRDSILQMAVEGKLVEQRKEEGTAEDLLASIREQRAQLVREKKAKPVKGGESVIWCDEDGHWFERRGKGEAVCIDEEIPFDIPDSWCWARMNALGDIVGGGTPKTNISEYWTVSDKGIPWITPADMRMMPSINIDGGARYISEEGLVHSSAQLMPAGSVIMSSRAPIGYLGIASRPLSTNQGFKSVVPAKEGMSRWLVVSLEALMPSIQKRASGTTFKEISGYEFGKTIVPIPPFVEQGRIVAKIDELMPLVDEYGKAQERRERLDRELPVKLRKSILQAAVEGKLTEQSDDDGPAAMLLAGIREKRAQLVREGKAKPVKGGESIIYRDDAGHWFERRGKSDPVCIDEEIPFDIPDTWCWARLGQICSKLVDGDHNPPRKSLTETPFVMLSASNVKDGRIDLTESVRYLDEKRYRESAKRVSLAAGDLLLTIVGTIGRSCVVGDKHDFVLQRSVAVLRTMLNVEYLKIVLDSPFVQHLMHSKAAGTAQKGFYLRQLAEVCIPIPSLAEQCRIVKKVDVIFE